MNLEKKDKPLVVSLINSFIICCVKLLPILPPFPGPLTGKSNKKKKKY